MRCDRRAKTMGFENKSNNIRMVNPVAVFDKIHIGGKYICDDI